MIPKHQKGEITRNLDVERVELHKALPRLYASTAISASGNASGLLARSRVNLIMLR